MSTVLARITETGGREATTRHIPPKLALAVGMPSIVPPKGWQWTPLTSLARLESGHTPSRRHPEYWGGNIPWISIGDAKAHDGGRIEDTLERTNQLGIENSSARVLPENTVCLSRTASVGYVVVMGRPMATSQDFVNWVCGKSLDHNFLKYLFVAEGDNLLRFSSGAVHQTIYFPEVKAFHICHPSLYEQSRIVRILDEAFDGVATARATAQKNLQNARALFASHLQSVFVAEAGHAAQRTLADVCEISSVLVDPRNKKYGDMVHVGGANIESMTGTLVDLKTAREENLISGKFVFDETMVLYSKIRPYLMKVARPHFAGLCSADIYPLAPKPDQLDRDYLFYLLLSPEFSRYANSGSARAGIPKINREHLFAFRVRLPSMAKQKQLAHSLDALRKQTDDLESIYQRKAAAIGALKKSLLYEAFNGAL